jgi:hypothetical protein
LALNNVNDFSIELVPEIDEIIDEFLVLILCEEPDLNPGNFVTTVSLTERPCLTDLDSRGNDPQGALADRGGGLAGFHGIQEVATQCVCHRICDSPLAVIRSESLE